MTVFRDGQIALVGQPNVGKSTLTNRLLGREVSIVTAKPNTTIRLTAASSSTRDYHLQLIDTPGIAPATRSTIGHQLESALPEVNLVLLVTRGTRWTADDEAWKQRLIELDQPTLWVINQMDRVKDKASVLQLIESTIAGWSPVAVLPMAATKQKDIDRLRNEMLKHLPEVELSQEEAAWYADSDQTTPDIDLNPQWVADCVREQLLWRLHDEMPYHAEVTVEAFEVEAELIRAQVIIAVPEVRHRKMLIGQKGDVIRDIGTRARKKLEKRWDRKVYIEIDVKSKN